jgi:putative hydrolase of the HAD superfamily
LHVLSQNHLDAKETLFIDDTLQHVEAAKACGINAYWLKTGDDIVNLFDKEGNLLL